MENGRVEHHDERFDVLTQLLPRIAFGLFIREPLD